MNRRLRFRDRLRGFASHGLRTLFAIAATLCFLVAVIIGGLLAARAIVESVRGVWGAVAFSFGILGVIFALMGYLAGTNLGGGVFLCTSGTGGTSPTSPTSATRSSTAGTSGGATGTTSPFCGTGPSGGTCPFACCCESGTCGRGCPQGGPTQDDGGC